jgi:hypothetical protein
MPRGSWANVRGGFDAAADRRANDPPLDFGFSVCNDAAASGSCRTDSAGRLRGAACPPILVATDTAS